MAVMDDVVENERPKESNEDRRLDKLRRRAQRAHEWRVQVWAQCQRKIDDCNASIAAMDADLYEPWEPDFTDPEKIASYVAMSITK